MAKLSQSAILLLFCTVSVAGFFVCDIWYGGFKLSHEWRRLNVTSNPRVATNWTWNDVTKTCREYHYCNKKVNPTDHYENQRKYDSCVDYSYVYGPFYVCKDTLVQQYHSRESPLAQCTKEIIEKDENPLQIKECDDIYRRETCLMGDVEKYCGEIFFKTFKQHFLFRMTFMDCLDRTDRDYIMPRRY